MTEIVIDETEEEEEEVKVKPTKTKTVSKRIKKGFSKVKDRFISDDTFLGNLLNNPTFMTSIKSGAGLFGTLMSVCLMIILMKFIKTM